MKLKICLLLAVVFILFEIRVLQSQNKHFVNLKLKETSSFTVDSQKTYTALKSPFGAGLASFVVPGLALGQFYNEQKNKAFIHIAITAGLFMFAITYAEMTNFHLDLTGGGSGSKKGSGIMAITAIAFMGNWLWSIVDAVISANNINKQIKLQKYRSDIWNNLRFGLAIDKNEKPCLKFALGL